MLLIKKTNQAIQKSTKWNPKVILPRNNYICPSIHTYKKGQSSKRLIYIPCKHCYLSSTEETEVEAKWMNY